MPACVAKIPIKRNIGMTASEKDATCPHDLTNIMDSARSKPRSSTMPKKPVMRSETPMRIPKVSNTRNKMIVRILTVNASIFCPLSLNTILIC
jgi:hypothetical protein